MNLYGGCTFRHSIASVVQIKLWKKIIIKVFEYSITQKV